MNKIPDKIEQYHRDLSRHKASENDIKMKRLASEIGNDYFGDLVDCLSGDYSVQDAIDFLYEKYFGKS